ncbi:MAG: DUF1156 domain-containing protein [Planctomycetaceae bacterium]|nr:MAG: DUF1156 domain-containing protein [Planctomycetaceae bacterium]
MAKSKKKTKKEELQEAVAEAVGAGRELHLESVDFSDPNRPKTCLEVDFPILPINHVAAIEGNAGKPIYQMSKWWARRRSSVFRAMLIAAATKAPEDESEAAKLVWDSYYGNHQKNEAFRKLKVADIFMGGGTTIVEGSRLGMQMYGNDLNPVAWLVVKNEMAQVDPDEVQKLLDAIEAEVKPQIMPFYACECPRGHKGKWTHKPTGKVMDDAFDPLSLTPQQRPEYDYAGPEVIYTFWAKHGPCQASECNHRTPIMSTPVIAIKTLTVKAWSGKECQACGQKFDLEQKEARMAPAAMLVVADTETPYAIMDAAGHYACPHCGHESQDEKAAHEGQSSSLGKAKNKKIELTLLIHPDWLKGSPGKDADGNWFGGSVTDTAEATAAWNEERAKSLKLIEVRGKLPESITCPDTHEMFVTGKGGGTIPRQKLFKCRNETCGRSQDLLAGIASTGGSPAFALYSHQGYCPECNREKAPYAGRFFDTPRQQQYDKSHSEWLHRKGHDLKGFYPSEKIPYGYMTPIQNDLPGHGFRYWRDLFNSRQLLGHSMLLRAIFSRTSNDNGTAMFVLGSFQQYLRNQCMLSFWHLTMDKLAPALSNSNFHPKPNVVEVGMFPPMGYGPWSSTTKPLISGLSWKQRPWDLIANEDLASKVPKIATLLTGKSSKIYPNDRVLNNAVLDCRSSTDLATVSKESVDLVITDPPFERLVQYSELSDFFYVWIKTAMVRLRPDIFKSESTPKNLEAVSNPARNPSDPKEFYQRLLTECWRESQRVLKPSGVLAFTFHHNEDGPWVAVLESLFDSGFYLEAAYPIRSDETKGNGEFGSKMVEFDIIHVCRKRLEDPAPISWARLRRQIMKDVRQLKEIIEQHQKEGLGEADLQVIRRGKALEYYSRHYGKVYIEKGRQDAFTVKDALVGINQLLDDENDTASEAPPVLAEPYTRQFLRLFADKTSLDRDQMQKHLRGTGVSPSEFLERGWCTELKKVFTVADPVQWAIDWKAKHRKGMARDFDQTYFVIGACYEDSGIKLSDTLNSGKFIPHPATSDLLDWFVNHGCDPAMKAAAKRAKQIYASWLTRNSKQPSNQPSLFDLEG